MTTTTGTATGRALATKTRGGVEVFWGTGRRKESVARVRVLRGTGIFKVNGRELDEFFVRDQDRQEILNPLRAVKALGRFDVYCNVGGGGISGQAGAIVLGIARALVKAEPETEAILRPEGYLSRDARMKERKKYGQKGARKRFQFSKR